MVNPQEAIALPDKWWHSTCNLDEHSVAIGFFESWRGKLHQAASRGDLKVVKELSKDIKALPTENGHSPLYAAAKRGHQSVVEVLGSIAKSSANKKMILSDAIGEASEFGELAIAKQLVSFRAQVGLAASAKESHPLLRAMKGGHLQTLTYLLKARADASVLTSNEGLDALKEAATDSHLSVVAFLLESKYYSSWKLNGRLEASTGRTLAHLAAIAGRVDVLRYLISRGASISLGDDDGNTMLHLIARKCKFPCHFDTARFLLEHGAKVGAENGNAVQPLHEAAFYGHLRCAEMLVQRRADVGASDNDGTLPLHAAAASGHVDILQLLLQSRADPTITVPATPVAVAAQHEHWSVVEALVRVGVLLDENTQELAEKAGIDTKAWRPAVKRRRRRRKKMSNEL